MNEAAIIIVPTDISKKIREIEESYNRYINEFRIPNDHKIIVNYSAGKDSTATLQWRTLFGKQVHAVMADTDNEHNLTVEFAEHS
ncbi:hypothetical protein BANRA_00007 [Escherichia coli]|nr:hypothetical protein [Escherichia coli]VCW99456.1 hypothetical protein BANRA_00007 [Escherichia coli]